MLSDTKTVFTLVLAGFLRAVETHFSSYRRYDDIAHFSGQAKLKIKINILQHFTVFDST